MNIKTSLTVMSLSLLPLKTTAQKSSKAIKPQVVEHLVNDTTSNIISYKDFIYPDCYYINADTIKLAQNILKSGKNKVWSKPADFIKPDFLMARKQVKTADKTTLVYDNFGNVKDIFSKNGLKIRTITRDPSGNLSEYMNISYKKSKKIAEDIYNEKGQLVESHKFHGNGTATLKNFDDKGNVQFEALYKTEFYEGEEIIPVEYNYSFDITPDF